MPDLLDHMYSSQQINIPPNLPYILKQYAKAAIRTQPHDLLCWSAAYFRAKANNTLPPVKERLEYPPFDSPSRLSPGFLKVLHKQLGENETVAAQVLYDTWLGVCLVKDALDSMLQVGDINATNKIPWLKFVAVAAGHLCSSLSKTMVLICEVLTEEPEGGSAMIPVDVFVNFYQFLARLDCGPETPEDAVPSEHVEGSVASQSTSASLYSGFKADGTIKKPVEEKDSNAGLMVWDDLKPEEKREIMLSPKYTEEPGATSEFGIEVLDNAQGPVTEVITIFSAQPTTPAKSISLLRSSRPPYPDIDDKTLSHTSLQENANWVQIEPTKLEVPEEDEGGERFVDLIGSSTDFVGQTASETKAEDKINEVEMKLASKSNEVDEAKEKLDNVVMPLKKRTQRTEGVQSVESIKETSSKDNTPEGSGLEETPSQDSGFEVGEKITTHFVNRDIEGSTMTYSSAEIRKGYVGEESEDHIERGSSENTIRAAETVQQIRLNESPECSSQEELDDISNALKSERSSADSQKSLECENGGTRKQHIPGIGPVIPEPQILAVVEYMQYWAAKQYGCVMPRNINHLLCPPLDLPPSSDLSD